MKNAKQRFLENGGKITKCPPAPAACGIGWMNNPTKFAVVHHQLYRGSLGEGGFHTRARIVDREDPFCSYPE